MPSATHGVVFQQDHRVKAVFVNQRLHERVLAPFVILQNACVVTKSVSINATLLAYLTAKSMYWACPERDFIVVGILQRHLVTAEVRENVIGGHTPTHWSC